MLELSLEFNLVSSSQGSHAKLTELGPCRVVIDHTNVIVWYAIRNELELGRKVMIWEVAAKYLMNIFKES